ncbi:exodeoxyribonuclease V, partial [Streptomyces sp. NPDC057699]
MTAHPRGETPDPAAEDHEAVEDSGPQAADTPGTPDEGGAGSTEGAEDGAAATEGAPDLEQTPGATEAPVAPALSEAEAELAAQRELRERIERRKAEKEGPIPAGTKLSGPAADLLAAVRAVESGEKPATAFFDSPASAPAPRRAAPDAAPARP